MTHISRRQAVISVLVLVAITLSACGGGVPNPPPGQSHGLSISAPQAGQTLSGTVAVAAGGVGGTANGLRFELAGQSVDAASDGTAVINTRGLPDGKHTLKATAVVANRSVSHSIDVVVDNDLPSSVTVGAAGGSLKSPAGSYASIPPGALEQGAEVSIDDLSKEEILAEYGVDYEALGVTFLGALDIDSSVADFALPVRVDLAGWAQAVQPAQQVIMFALSSDVDGDGIGELMAVADAQATADGSVITRPQPRSEVYGFGSGGSGLSAQQVTSSRPGELVTVTGRGYVAGGAMSNTARFGSGTEVLIHVANAEAAPFNPLQTIELVLPALPSGGASLRLHNRGTGFVSDPLSVTVGSLGSGSTAAWDGLIGQLRAAVEGLASGRPDTATLAAAWLTSLEQADVATANAMAQHSGLVSAANLTTLQGIGAEGYGPAQRTLVRHHALLLDAVAASVPDLVGAGELARLLLLLDPSTAAGPSATALAATGSASLRPQQGEITIGDPCVATGGSSSGATGMGGAPPPGGAACGPVGGGGPGPAGLGSGGSPLGPQQAGGFGPVEGAVVRILSPGTSDKLSPFTSLTDAEGYYRIPFVPEGEPFTVQAIDPATGAVATANGVGPSTGEGVVIPLVFGPPSSGPGAPTASFTITPVPGGTVAGPWNYRFDATSSSDSGGEIVEYVWSFGGVAVVGNDYYATVEKGFGRNGSYTINLTVIDDDGQVGIASQQLVIDDLPYDYWSGPPELVTVTEDGQLPDEEAHYTFRVSADGRYVLFTTTAGSLHADDDNGLSDLYLKDMDTGTIELISRAAPGIEVWPDVAMSSDARYFAFTEEVYQSIGTGPSKIVVKDRQEGTSEEFINPGGFHRNTVHAVSDDGSNVLFHGSTLNNPERPVYVADLATDEFTRLGLRLDELSYARITAVDMSDDGRFVTFYSSDGSLVENDTNGVQDAFLSDLQSGDTVRISLTQAGEQANDHVWPGAMSADGRFVTLWTSATNLGGVGDGFEHLYVKDTVTGALDLVSANAAGVEADGDTIAPVISDDGRYVAFGSYASNLVPIEDSRDDGWGGVGYQGLSYVKDRQTGRVALVTMGVNDAFPDDWDQIEPRIGGDGRYVLFSSWATNLVPRAMSGELHLYRIENPFWEP